MSYIPAVKDNGAFRDLRAKLLQTENRFDQRRLATAGLTCDTDDLTRFDFKGNFSNDLEFTISNSEVVDLQ